MKPLIFVIVSMMLLIVSTSQASVHASEDVGYCGPRGVACGDAEFCCSGVCDSVYCNGSAADKCCK